MHCLITVEHACVQIHLQFSYKSKKKVYKQKHKSSATKEHTSASVENIYQKEKKPLSFVWQRIKALKKLLIFQEAQKRWQSSKVLYKKVLRNRIRKSSLALLPRVRKFDRKN